MATSKALVICLVALLVCSVAFVEGDEGDEGDEGIGYDPIRRSGGFHCRGKCLPPPANPYGRGCEKGERCRGAPPPSMP
ncbi:hypothetical protein FH972_000119 [Carpinus fangiana]|uniref:Uncharacterized protein n=1 Tax=Carpinus fangiana TaxID=176857 RepID=A0A5N6Q7V6_9ROSI|nr:hypothetical protein FH972_000119 [Carpinus fangiana]